MAGVATISSSPEGAKEVFERLNLFIPLGHLYEAETKELESQIQLVSEQGDGVSHRFGF